MQLIHSRTTMLAREASLREEELVAMKVVELKEELGERADCRGPLGQQRCGCAMGWVVGVEGCPKLRPARRRALN